MQEKYNYEVTITLKWGMVQYIKVGGEKELEALVQEKTVELTSMLLPGETGKIIIRKGEKRREGCDR